MISWEEQKRKKMVEREKQKIKELTKKAKRGDAEAAFLLGEHYYKDWHALHDYKKAIKWLQKAADKNYGEAYAKLAVCYHFGYGVEKDLTKARYFSDLSHKYKIAEMNEKRAQNANNQPPQSAPVQQKPAPKTEATKELISDVKSENVTEQPEVNEQKPEPTKKTAAKKVTAKTRTTAKKEVKSQPAEKKEEKAVNNRKPLTEFEKLQLLAESGDETAQFNLGILYFKGEGVTRDCKLAIELFKKAAQKGLVQAQINLGVFYYNGQGVSQDKYEALKWFEMAAKNGDAELQYNVGACYLNGEGCYPDYYKAVYWLGKAAEKGHVKAEVALGRCYFNGNGVRKNFKTAFDKFEWAADQGDAEAMGCLALFYYSGCITDFFLVRNFVKALELWRSAAAMGDEFSKEALIKYFGEG